MQSEPAAQWRATLQHFLAVGSVEIRDAAGRITPSAPLSWEVRGGESKPLLHL